MDATTWILAIYVLGLAAMVVELFVPGAIVGITGFCMVVGSIIYAASTGHQTLAVVLLASTLVFLPFFFILWKNVLGRLFSVSETLKDFRSSARSYEELLGKDGHALSSLRPSGSAEVDGNRYAVVTRGEMLDKGSRVKVIDVSGTRLIVKRAGGGSEVEGTQRENETESDGSGVMASG